MKPVPRVFTLFDAVLGAAYGTLTVTVYVGVDAWTSGNLASPNPKRWAISCFYSPKSNSCKFDKIFSNILIYFNYRNINIESIINFN